MKDRPLTDAQERALIELVDRRGSEREWAKPCRNSTTLFRLSELGLVELRFRSGTLDVEGRATDAGVDLCHSMGD